MIKAAELRKGRTIEYEDALYVVHEAQHVTKGNKRSYMQVKLKNLTSGQLLDVRFSVDDRLSVPFLDNKEFEYLYRDGADYVFMDTETYDQVHVSDDLLGDGTAYLKPNEKVSCQIYEGKILTLELPHVVELKVTETPPVVKGATVTNQPKDATLETGVRVRVPAFISPGQVIRVDTRTGEYLERAK